MKLENIEAVLFDSGRVLNISCSGHWFITPNFFDYVDESKFYQLSDKKRNHAFFKAGNYINDIPKISTKEEEFEQFKVYYEIFATELPELDLDHLAIEHLAKDLVYNPKKYRFFDDALKVIPFLHKRYKLGIVSDAWPSLKDVYSHVGLDAYFSSFVISSMIGVTKPDERMYLTALEELNVSPDKAVFIDDNLKNCLGAQVLGIKAILICRDKHNYLLQKIRSIGKGYEVIYSLEELMV
ncbi:MAG: HAD-IA family hydrolase [Turicibacter sp.]